jgi:hypothetical protein
MTQLANQTQRRSWSGHPSVAPKDHIIAPAVAQIPDLYNGYYMPPPVYDHPYDYRNSTPVMSHPAPSLPPKIQIQPPSQRLPPSPQGSSQHTPSPRSIERPPTPPPRPSVSSFASSIEPDPLPPHSNPQALTATQSAAFADSKPVPPLRIDKNEVYCSESGLTQYAVNREAAHLPNFLSTKPRLTVTCAADGTVVGRVKFHALSSSSIDLTINGRSTSLAQSYSLMHHQRWGFQTTSLPNRDETWYWKKDKSTKGAMLEDSKSRSAKCLARIKGDLLSFEAGHLSQESFDEVVVSAIATIEAARRLGKGKDIVDLGATVGDFAAGDAAADTGRHIGQR